MRVRSFVPVATAISLTAAGCSSDSDDATEVSDTSATSNSVATVTSETTASSAAATPTVAQDMTTSVVVDADPGGAETCADLADQFVGLTQRMIEVLGTRSDTDMEGDIPPEIVAASEEFGEWFFGSGGERVSELCPGGSAEWDSLVCEQASSFEALGEAAERHIRDNVPPCDLQPGPPGTTAPSSDTD